MEKFFSKRKICTKDSFRLAAETANLLTRERITPDDVMRVILKANELGWETTDLRIAIKFLEEDQPDMARKYIARQVGDFLDGLSTCMDALFLMEPEKLLELLKSEAKEQRVEGEKEKEKKEGGQT